MWTHSESMANIFGAIAKAQAEMASAKKTTRNSFLNSRYADLAECWNTCREPLTKNGLSVIQLTGKIIESVHFEGNQDNPKQVVEKKQEITTIIGHESGEWICEVGEFVITKHDIQVQGGSITYGRRYSLAGAVGLAQADDDGNSNMVVEADEKGEIHEEHDVWRVDGVAWVQLNKKPQRVADMSVGQWRYLVTQDWAKDIKDDVKDLLTRTTIE